mmetsp:Transcript_8467/g.17963  ORF Transcript_8467/g.17963 Transcript_8467/m.17963 type:complete len:283 (+) Transcript_8467:970-1818(+)
MRAARSTVRDPTNEPVELAFIIKAMRGMIQTVRMPKTERPASMTFHCQSNTPGRNERKPSTLMMSMISKAKKAVNRFSDTSIRGATVSPNRSAQIPCASTPMNTQFNMMTPLMNISNFGDFNSNFPLPLVDAGDSFEFSDVSKRISAVDLGFRAPAGGPSPVGSWCEPFCCRASFGCLCGKSTLACSFGSASGQRKCCKPWRKLIDSTSASSRTICPWRAQYFARRSATSRVCSSDSIWRSRSKAGEAPLPVHSVSDTGGRSGKLEGREGIAGGVSLLEPLP